MTTSEQDLEVILNAYRQAEPSYSREDLMRLKTSARNQLRRGHSARVLMKIVKDMAERGYSPNALPGFVRTEAKKYPGEILCWNGRGQVNRKLIPESHLRLCGCEYCRAVLEQQ